MSIKEAIFASDDCERMEATEWGQSFYIRHLTAQDVTKIQQRQDTPSEQLAGLVIAGCVDEHGAPIFTWQDIHAVAKKSFKKLTELAETIAKFNGLLVEDDAEGNSEPTPSE